MDIARWNVVGAASRDCVTYRVWGAAEHNLPPLVQLDLLFAVRVVQFFVLTVRAYSMPLGSRGWGWRWGWPGWRDGLLFDAK